MRDQSARGGKKKSAASSAAVQVSQPSETLGAGTWKSQFLRYRESNNPRRKERKMNREEKG